MSQTCHLCLQWLEKPHGDLHPKESLLAQGFGSAKRQKEFLAARSAARQGFSQLGFLPLPVGKGPKGEPLWPPGVVASLAHDDALAACLIAKRGSGLVSLGLDFEPLHRQVSPGVYKTIYAPTELERLTALGDWALRAGFCAKEAIFKCLSPRTGVYLGFLDAQLVSLSAQSFVATLSPGEPYPGLPAQVQGQLWQQEGRIFAALGLKGP